MFSRNVVSRWVKLFIDCEQSLFFFRFSESNVRARERRSRETRETRAWPFACLVFCSTDYRKKRDCSLSKLVSVLNCFQDVKPSRIAIYRDEFRRMNCSLN